VREKTTTLCTAFAKASSRIAVARNGLNVMSLVTTRPSSSEHRHPEDAGAASEGNLLIPASC
jgi:hypothetical protein